MNQNNFSYGQIISYNEMSFHEGINLQRGMNFRVNNRCSIFLMNKSINAPYNDREEDDGRILIYEGHDVISKSGSTINPKSVDQPEFYTSTLTENGKFYQAAQQFVKDRDRQLPEIIKVYEKIKPGIWVFNGLFKLIDAWREMSDGRKVFKFKLEIIEDKSNQIFQNQQNSLCFSRLIPSSVKREVYARDQGKCVKCGCKENLHFDHILPFSKGGTSLKSENIQLLCAKHNLEKSNTFLY